MHRRGVHDTPVDARSSGQDVSHGRRGWERGYRDHGRVRHRSQLTAKTEPLPGALCTYTGPGRAATSIVSPVVSGGLLLEREQEALQISRQRRAECEWCIAVNQRYL